MTEAEWLAALPDMVFRAILLLARIGAVVIIMPGLGEQEVPSNYPSAFGMARWRGW
jgi:flagellar biosynthesis protein FliR